MDTFTGHYHGYGPWTGSREEFAKEALRRPGKHPQDEATQNFLRGSMTPVQLGHSLLRKDQTTRGRTWTDVADALDWLSKTYVGHPPTGDELALETKLPHAEEALTLGSDVNWAYYTRGQFVSFCVIACPNRFFPNIPCPLPPRQT